MTWKTPSLKHLAHTIHTIKTESDLLNFLRDLCTHEELADLSIRWQIVRLLHQGMPYRKVAEKTGVSTTTVTRIAHWLHHGTGGYQAVLATSPTHPRRRRQKQ